MKHGYQQQAGFSLMEVLLSTAILAIIMVGLMTAMGTVQRTFVTSRGKTHEFREARQAFELLTRTLSQATLNTYWDYYYAGTKSNVPPATGSSAPSGYVRQSELQFLVGAAADLVSKKATPATHPGHAIYFQVPAGLMADGRSAGTLLNARGYAVRFGSDEENRPPFLREYDIATHWRYQLVEYRPPSERSEGGGSIQQGNMIYAKPTTWFQEDADSNTRVVADNILLLLFSARVADSVASATKQSPWHIAPQYRYNSLDTDNSTAGIDSVRVSADGKVYQGTQHLLPPTVMVTLVVAEETSFQRWINGRQNHEVDILTEAGAPFAEASRYEHDIDMLKAYLNRQKLNYRVFSTSVALRNARWDGRDH